MASTFGTTRVQESRREWDMLKEADRIRRDRIDRDRADRDRQLQDAATKQTLRRLRRDVIVVLRESGDLSPEQARAAAEIARVYAAIAGAQNARIGAYGDERGGGGGVDWSPYLSKAWRERYKPWADAMGLQMVRGTTSVASLVFLIACDNLGFRQVADHLRMDQRTVKRVLQQSLEAYAEWADWIEPKVPQAVAAVVSNDVVGFAKMTA